MDFEMNGSIFVLDTETGGLDPESDSLMEVAGVVIQNGRVVAKYSSLVKPNDGKVVCNDFARKIHQISDEMVLTKGKSPAQIANDLAQISNKYFDGKPMIICGHNVHFDVNFVKKMFKNANVENLSYDKVFSRNVLDTATMALILKTANRLPFERTSLDNILKFYNINAPEKERHTALGDALMTAKAFVLLYNDLVYKERTITNDDFDKDYEEDYDDTRKLSNINKR